MELCDLYNCNHLCRNILNFYHCEASHLVVCCVCDCLCSNLYHGHYSEVLDGNLRLDHFSPENILDVSDQDWISAQIADCCIRYPDACTPLVTEISGWSGATEKSPRAERASCSSSPVTSSQASWAPGCAYAHWCSVLAVEEGTKTQGWSQRWRCSCQHLNMDNVLDLKY